AAPPAPPAKASGKTKAPEGNAETKTAEEAEEARAAEEEVEVVEEEGVSETEEETETEVEGEVETVAVVETEVEAEAEAVAEARSAGADSVKTAPSNEAFGNAPNLHEPDGKACWDCADNAPANRIKKRARKPFLTKKAVRFMRIKTENAPGKGADDKNLLETETIAEVD
ncbi:MAG: hypothetical protein LBG65_01780, partial [Puniceicoccales bacterium]|nr:hypothetical protein [Puniceicoccales bacterium]